MKRIVASLVVIGWSLVQSNLGFSQSSKEVADLRREIQALRAGQTAIQKDLLEIKNLLLQREIQALRDAGQGRPAAPAPAPVPAQQIAVISVADAPFKGEKSAKLTLIDFTDYQ
jgi:hypothetical protein